MTRQRTTITLLVLVTWAAALYSQTPFDRFFVDKTLRLDYNHTGTKGEEIFSVEQIYEVPQWAGSRVNLIDTLNLGQYQVRVYDVQTNQLVYSRGYSSIFGEWRTTEEAADGIYRTFQESVLVPFPRRPVQLVLASRNKRMRFVEVWTTYVDPSSRFVNREPRLLGLKVLNLVENGPPATKVDLVLLGDGYRIDEMDKFRSDAEHYVKVLFDTSPFKEHKDKFNVRAVESPSADSGIDEPRKDLWRRTALGASYNSLDSPRYILSTDNRDIRDVAQTVPYDFIYILINSKRYGGGGIFNLYATGMTSVEDPRFAWHVDYMFTHEFGHSFAGLADEYYTSSVSYSDFYPAGVEPWEPNITALLNPKELKWRSFVEPGTPIPTPWSKSQFDSLEAIRATWDRSAPGYYEKWLKLRQTQLDILEHDAFWGKVGAFEGAGYASTGLYRPSIDCRMFSLSLEPFDPVCQAAITRMIDFVSR